VVSSSNAGVAVAGVVELHQLKQAAKIEVGSLHDVKQLPGLVECV
jgi:hypothetical protein